MNHELRNKNKFICLSLFLGVFCFFFFAKAVSAKIIIAEIMYNLEGADDKREWVEIYNSGNEPVDLSDWRFNDGSNHLLVPPPEKGGQGSMIIQPNRYAVLAADAAVFLNEHSGFSETVIDTVISLNNTSDTLKIIDNQSVEIDVLIYESGWGGSGNGMSLEKLDFLGPNNPSSWQESKISGGTPGNTNSLPDNQPLPENNNTENNQINQEENSASEQTEPQQENLDPQPNQEIQQNQQQNPINYSDKIYINEIYPNTLGVDNKEEWIEIYNDSSEDIDLKNWKLDDEEGGSNAFTIPGNTIINAKDYLVLYRNKTNIALNNDKDEVRLFWPNETLANSTSYSSAPKGQSYNRIDGSWVWSAIITPGNKNYKDQPIDNDKDAASNNTIANENLDQKTTILNQESRLRQDFGGQARIKNQEETKTPKNSLSLINQNENENKTNDVQKTNKTLAEINQGFSHKIAKNYYWLILIIAPLSAFGILRLKYFIKNK